MSDCNHILLVESSDGASDKLAGRVRALGLEPVLVANLGEACVILEEGPLYITAALLPTSLPSRELKAAVKQLRKVACVGDVESPVDVESPLDITSNADHVHS